ncbi:MAG: hypothetical protein ABI321_21090 [Polyangia bacterium]
MIIDKLEYAGWRDCYRLDNGTMEVVVVADVGPRIMDVRLRGGENVLFQVPEQLGGVGEGSFQVRGGWRLWVAPEDPATTCALDNASCSVEILDGGLRLVGPAQEAAGIVKEVELRLSHERLRLVSRVRNVGTTTRRYACWSVPMMRPGGRAFIPLDVGNARDYATLRRLVLWSYTSLSDPRYHIGAGLVQVDQGAIEPKRDEPGRPSDESKLGTDSKQGWAGYLVDDTLFWKRWHVQPGLYPHGDATTEIFSNRELLELEHLGPLTTLQPGDTAELVEDWWLFGGVTVPTEEHAALAVLRDYVRRTRPD